MASKKRARRVISKSKMYGIHPWVDQVDAIDQIIKETGIRESIVLRKLLDEALTARRRKAADEALSELTSGQESAQYRKTLEDLLGKVSSRTPLRSACRTLVWRSFRKHSQKLVREGIWIGSN